jgi:two-component system, sensor histidine kinase and response regulator
MREEIKKATILIVDDDPTNSAVLAEYLERANYQTIIATNGESALELSPQVRPDLFLMDVMMPDLNGFETCLQLKEQPDLKDIPVIFMTALGDVRAKMTGFEVGGVDYITKPFQPEEVIARVSTHLTLRRQQQQLQQQAEELRAHNAEKDHFLSMIAHDLRSPFSMLRLLIGVAAENVEGSGQNELENILNLLKKSSEHVYTLLENLLTWSQIQHGVMRYHQQELDVQKIIAQNVAQLKPHADQKQIVIKNDTPAELVAYGDYNMIDAVMRNLISNALKFSYPGGKIMISAESAPNLVTITVADTGIGIAPEYQAKIFQLDPVYRRKGTAREQGTGLGLILCKEFVERHGGKIWFHSEVQKGSTFQFTLPKNS